MNLPPITPVAIVLFIIFGIPIIVLSCFFVHMCGVLNAEEKAKEVDNA